MANCAVLLHFINSRVCSVTVQEGPGSDHAVPTGIKFGLDRILDTVAHQGRWQLCSLKKKEAFFSYRQARGVSCCCCKLTTAVSQVSVGFEAFPLTLHIRNSHMRGIQKQKQNMTLSFQLFSLIRWQCKLPSTLLPPHSSLLTFL